MADAFLHPDIAQGLPNMPIASMTGFARTSGHSGTLVWAWEIKTVNSRGLDLRLRLPPGFDQIEPEARALIARKLGRGACHANLSIQRESEPVQARINIALLQSVSAALRDMPADHGLAPASLDALLGLRGVVEMVEKPEDEAARALAIAALLQGLEQALAALVAARLAEGAALACVLHDRCASIAGLVALAETSPARQPAAIQARLAQNVSAILGVAPALDPLRLYQEAVLIAAKSDIREELDRLATHIGAAQNLLRDGGPVGRRLDFLAQELGREASTLSAKGNDTGLAAIGMELRVEIEQFREQIQNIE